MHPEVPTRTWLTTALAALVLALVAGAVLFNEVRRQTQLHRAQVVAGAELSAEQSARVLQTVRLKVRELARRIEADWADGIPPEPGLQLAIAAALGERTPVRDVRVIAADGDLVADRHVGHHDHPTALAGRDYVAAHRTGWTGEVFVGQPHAEVPGAPPAFVLSRKYRAPDGRFAGVVAALIDPLYFRHMYDRQRHLGEVEVALTDVSGVILAASSAFDREGLTVGDSVSDRAMAHAYVSSARPAWLPVVPGAPATMTATAPLLDFGLYTVATIPRPPYAWLWQRSTAGIALLWLGAVLLAGVYFHLRARQRREEAAARAEADRARAAAEQANLAKSNFLATMSHELRTPLNAIIGFSQIIRDEAFGPVGQPRYAEYAADMHASGTHLLELINDILDISKIESGRTRIQPEPVFVAGELNSCVSLLRQRARDRGVDLRLALPRPSPPLTADRRAFKQIVFNLLANAINYTPDGGHVDVATAVADGTVSVIVADTGIGIPADMIERVQRPFEQVNNRYGHANGGTGLGLALVKGLTELHGGTVRIDSTIGRGTTVTVALPQQPAGPAARDADHAEASAAATADT
jgi:signal transduction histidine kinase